MGDFSTPHKGKKTRTISPVHSHVMPSIDSPCSSQAIGSPSTSTSASVKLGTVFPPRKEGKETIQITVSSPNLCESLVKVSQVRSNLVIDCSVLQSVLSICAVCRSCKREILQIWDKGIKSCFAYFLTLRCDSCGASEDFWTVSGKFASKIHINDKNNSKRNDTVYRSRGVALAGRLIGVGRRGLSIYHAATSF